MSDEIVSDSKTSNDEKSSGSGKVCIKKNKLFRIIISLFFSFVFKLESMSPEELIKIIKNQVILKKKLETKINELTSSNTNSNQIEEVIKIDLIQ